MTNSIYLITVLCTNWTFTGDTMFLSGTNYSQLRGTVVTQTLIEEVMLCTNHTIYRISEPATNSLMKWQVVGQPGMPSPPPLPNVPNRPQNQ